MAKRKTSRRRAPAAEHDTDIRTTIPKGDGPKYVAAGTYEAVVRSTLMKLGAKDPDALIRASDPFMKNCQVADVDPKVCATTMYGTERHRHEVVRTTINEAASEGAVEEWEVIVRRHGASMERILGAAAPRKPDEVRGADVIFGEFYDDEKAQVFARKMTKAGFVAYYGPRRKMAAEEGVQSQIAAKKGCPPCPEENGDPSAMELAPVVSEAAELAPVISEGSIAWSKMARDPARHEADMALAEKYGPIKSPEKVYELVGPELQKETSEVFLVIPLNLRGELVCSPIEVARGQRSKVSVGVEDVMRAVLASGCEGYLVVHQHPTGKCHPSKADRQLTEQIKLATKPFGSGVKFLDHCVVGSRQIYSICEDRMYPARGKFKA
jgi:hypothetical protein